ncbi:hypothetical protein COCVIDRAFT_97414, partial [Bipolaris victoriae FI3]
PELERGMDGMEYLTLDRTFLTLSPAPWIPGLRKGGQPITSGLGVDTRMAIVQISHGSAI